MIDIIHMSPWPIGGATSYIVHLAKTFAAAGVAHRVLRPSKRTENRKREMGSFGVFYQNVAWEDISRSRGVPLLASAPTDPDDAQRVAAHVLDHRGKFVFHDPNEFRIYPHWGYEGTRDRTICIRETGLKHVQGVFIPHPYVRSFENDNVLSEMRPRHAVSIARTSAVKNSHWILEANAKLPEELRVVLRGELNRMWWNFNVSKKYPSIKPPEQAGFPRDFGAAATICRDYTYMVDLTIFKEDGGGTQYSFLEAMDAGAVPILSSDWCSYPGPAADFGMAVAGAEGLANVLNKAYEDDALRLLTYKKRRANYNYLDRVHNPAGVAVAYERALKP